MGCVSSKQTKDAGDQEPYQRSTTATDQSTAVSRSRSERPEVGYDVGQDSVKLSRDSGDAEDRHKSSSSSSERRRTAEQRTASDATRQPASSAAAVRTHTSSLTHRACS